MSVADTSADLDERTSVALELLASMREGRTKLSSLHSLLEQTRGDLELDLDSLNELLLAASRRGLVVLENNHWAITERGRELLQRLSTEPEQRDSGGDGEHWKGAPFDPGTLSVNTVNDPVFSVLELIKSGRIFLQPAFQRNFVWDKKRQSQLIESIMLKLPLPAFYLDEMPDNRRQVMDGLQRLSTLNAFCNKQELRLTRLRYLTQYEGKSFDELPAGMKQLILHDTRLTMHIIQAKTSDRMRFEVFARVNTGGLTLTAQEIRHALYQGKATTLLRQLADHDVFKRVTGGSISSLRMDDRECILRYLAFRLHDYQVLQMNEDERLEWKGMQQGEEPPRNLDELLNRTMRELNKLSDATVETHSDVFIDSLLKAELLFGPHAFRKIDVIEQARLPDGSKDSLHISLPKLEQGEVQWKSGRRSPVNKPLFEVWTVALVPYPIALLERNHVAIVQGFLDLLRDDDFNSSITYATGDPTTIAARFRRVERLLEATVR
jgi:hypothetical protein